MKEIAAETPKKEVQKRRNSEKFHYIHLTFFKKMTKNERNSRGNAKKEGPKKDK